MPDKESITWFDLKTIVSIVGSAIMVATSFAAINTRLALIEQKMESIAQSQAEMLELWKSTETRYGLLSLDVKELQTLHNVK